MATIIEKTIGTGGDYATPALWYASIPANLVTADEIHRGLLLNQEFVLTASLNFTGKTTSASCYIELTTAPGCSFVDHPSRATNPLRYNSAVGACITGSGTFIPVHSQQNHTRISKIMIRNTNTTTNAPAALVCNGVSSVNYVDRCILESNAISSSLKGAVRISNAGSTFTNSVAICHRADPAATLGTFQYAVVVQNCTFLNVSGTTYTTGIITQYTSANFKNVYIGGVTAPEDGVIAITKTNCFSSATATGYTTVPMSTVTFENVTSGTQDARLKFGSGLIDAGTSDVSNAPTDILGVARPYGAAYDVGAHEYAVQPDPAASISWTEDNDTSSMVVVIPNRGQLAWTEDSDVSSASGTVGAPSRSTSLSWVEDDDVSLAVVNVAVANGTLTTGAFKNNTGTILPNLTGLTVTVLSLPDLGFVKTFPLQSTDGSGVLAITDPLIYVGTSYALVTTNNAGTVGVEKYQAT